MNELAAPKTEVTAVDDILAMVQAHISSDLNELELPKITAVTAEAVAALNELL